MTVIDLSQVTTAPMFEMDTAGLGSNAVKIALSMLSEAGIPNMELPAVGYDAWLQAADGSIRTLEVKHTKQATPAFKITSNQASADYFAFWSSYYRCLLIRSNDDLDFGEFKRDGYCYSTRAKVYISGSEFTPANEARSIRKLKQDLGYEKADPCQSAPSKVQSEEPGTQASFDY